MKKIIIPITLLVVIVAMIVLISKGTFSLYKSNKTINVHSTSGNLVCDAEVTDAGTSVYGYKLINIKVKNYTTENNVDTITDVPLKYRVTITSSNGTTFREFVAPDSNRTTEQGAGFTNTSSLTLPSASTYDTFTTTKSDKSYNVEVKNTNDVATGQTVSYNLTLDCYQQ